MQSKKTLITLACLFFLAFTTLFSGVEQLSTVELDQVLGIVDSLYQEESLVVKVIDGDTIELSDGSKVRYIGVDTPETKHPFKGVECYGEEASEYNRRLVEGRWVRLEKDVSDVDKYGRLLRYVWLDGELINQKLVEEGYAYASSFPPDISKQDIFQEAQKRAIKKGKGLWSTCEVNSVDEINQFINSN